MYSSNTKSSFQIQVVLETILEVVEMEVARGRALSPSSSGHTKLPKQEPVATRLKTPTTEDVLNLKLRL